MSNVELLERSLSVEEYTLAPVVQKIVDVLRANNGNSLDGEPIYDTLKNKELIAVLDWANDESVGGLGPNRLLKYLGIPDEESDASSEFKGRVPSFDLRLYQLADLYSQLLELKELHPAWHTSLLSIPNEQIATLLPSIKDRNRGDAGVFGHSEHRIGDMSVTADDYTLRVMTGKLTKHELWDSNIPGYISSPSRIYADLGKANSKEGLGEYELQIIVDEAVDAFEVDRNDSDMRTMFALLLNKEALDRVPKQYDNNGNPAIHKILGNRGDSGQKLGARLGVNIYLNQEGRHSVHFTTWNVWDNFGKCNSLVALKTRLPGDVQADGNLEVLTQERLGNIKSHLGKTSLVDAA